jgi:hypothetical protein
MRLGGLHEVRKSITYVFVPQTVATCSQVLVRYRKYRGKHQHLPLDVPILWVGAQDCRTQRQKWARVHQASQEGLLTWVGKGEPEEVTGCVSFIIAVTKYLREPAEREERIYLS